MAHRSGFAALLTTIMASTAAQLLLKIGVSLLPAGALPGFPASWWILGGLGCYAISLLAWLLTLTRLPLSYAYPLLGTSYVLVYLGAMALPMIAESFSLVRAMGILLVAAGVALVSTSTPLPRGLHRNNDRNHEPSDSRPT
ncbi:MAG: 4-amino-4-deoxy-L-arabinose-phospho-UDP flippase [Gammaproteobacteria bacterium]